MHTDSVSPTNRHPLDGVLDHGEKRTAAKSPECVAVMPEVRRDHLDPLIEALRLVTLDWTNSALSRRADANDAAETAADRKDDRRGVVTMDTSGLRIAAPILPQNVEQRAAAMVS